jgi:hypothetical protein
MRPSTSRRAVRPRRCRATLTASLLGLSALAWLAPGESVAQLNISGEWTGRYHEDFDDRVPGDVQGDFTGVPLSDAARRYCSRARPASAYARYPA